MLVSPGASFKITAHLAKDKGTVLKNNNYLFLFFNTFKISKPVNLFLNVFFSLFQHEIYVFTLDFRYPPENFQCAKDPKIVPIFTDGDCNSVNVVFKRSGLQHGVFKFLVVLHDPWFHLASEFPSIAFSALFLPCSLD